MIIVFSFIFLVIFVMFLVGMLAFARKRHPDEDYHRSTNGVYKKQDSERTATNWFVAIKELNNN